MNLTKSILSTSKFRIRGIVPLQWVFFVLALVFASLFQSVYLFKENAYEYFDVAASDILHLELVRDYSFLAGAVLIAPLLRSLGHKRVILVSVIGLSLLMILMPWAKDVLVMSILVGGISLTFAVCTIGIYASFAVLARSVAHHASMVSLFEGFSLLGMCLSYVLFGQSLKTYGFEWKYGFWVLLPLLAIVLMADWRMMNQDKTFEKRRFTPKKDFNSFLREVISFSNNSVVIIFVVCLMMTAVTEIHFKNWITHYTETEIRLPNFIKSNFFALVILMMGLGRLLTGALLLKVSKLVLVVACVGVSAFGVYFTVDQVVKQNLIAITKLNDVPLSLYFVLGTAVFSASITPMVYSSLLGQVGKYRQGSLLCLVLVITILSEQVSKTISAFLYETFSFHIAYFFILIPLTLIFVLFELFYRDLRSE
ncbi:MAG: MFS transporter [Cytophagales bacterium]|nr:MAG: MFS transporter [Cytophagales bacterium]TAF61959.1 MAG: MFS transporter [Cytophagales bacterium]